MIGLIQEIADALAQLIRGHMTNNAEQERNALLRLQRVASNELAKREAEST